MKIRTLIVDDEALGRSRVRHLLKGEADLEIVGECANGHEAVAALRGFHPDLVFLDVQMPEMNGFEVLAHLGAGPMPVVIFVTAHDQFALKAFEAQALDYLLKPFDDDRFHQSLQRARAQLAREEVSQTNERLLSLIKGFAPQKAWLTRLAVKTEGRMVFLTVPEIARVEAVGNYLKLYVGSETHLLRGRLSELEKQLDPNQFFRIHRSTLVNLDRVKEFHPLFKGDGVVILKDGTRLDVSRNCSQRLQQQLQPQL
jgi:two-component system, LytTR family, response regulator